MHKAGQMWVFGYGSLIWNPGFPVAETRIARVEGFHRSFCMRSIHHRGTPADPGLVLALDRVAGASCHGLALRVVRGAEDETLSYLRARELISSAYVETHLPAETEEGPVEALAYIVDPHHVQYCGGLPLDQQARIIAASTGERGANADYLFQTAEHLEMIGLGDGELGWLAQRVREIITETG